MLHLDREFNIKERGSSGSLERIANDAECLRYVCQTGHRICASVSLIAFRSNSSASTGLPTCGPPTCGPGWFCWAISGPDFGRNALPKFQNEPFPRKPYGSAGPVVWDL